jgi:hypothetical protein
MRDGFLKELAFRMDHNGHGRILIGMIVVLLTVSGSQEKLLWVGERMNSFLDLLNWKNSNRKTGYQEMQCVFRKN